VRLVGDASRSRSRISAALVGLVVLVLVGWFVRELTADDTAAPQSPQSTSSAASAEGSVALPGASSGLRVQPLSALPTEAKATWRLIQSGGPFPYDRDGVVFGNRERLLPPEKSGYYHEYTVDTPGSDDRGARRLITGSERELYYTADHYESFVVVDPGR
jgi:guanyl-specific ribonuclease Sa